MKHNNDKRMYLPRAALGRGFVTPRYSAGARRFMILIGGWYLRLFEGIKEIRLDGEEILIKELERFYNGEHRLIIAFRHVAKEDAPLMVFSLNRKLQRIIRRANRRRDRNDKIIGHAKFLYGRDVLNWAGKGAAWLFPRIGCVPVQNRSTNREGLNLLRKEVQEGNLPIALAPESQVTYQMYSCSDISSGISSLASWGQQSSSSVTVIPVALGYRHSEEPESFIRSVLSRWEMTCGITLESEGVLAMLAEATEGTIGLLEQLYDLEAAGDQRSRILAVCERALAKAEDLAQVHAEGTMLDRLFRIRYRGVDDTHPESFDPKELPPLGRSLADFHALEAHVYLRHSQVADVLQYIDPAYVAAPCSAGRACEYALNLLDVLNRAQGGNINTRYSPAGKKSLVKFGAPLHLDRMEGLAELGRKERLQRVTAGVQQALEETSLELERVWESRTFS